MDTSLKLMLVGLEIAAVFGLFGTAIGRSLEIRFNKIHDVYSGFRRGRPFPLRMEDRWNQKSRVEKEAWRAGVSVTFYKLYERFHLVDYFGFKFGALIGLLSFLVYLIIVFF